MYGYFCSAMLLLLEFLNLRNRILDLLIYFQKVGVQDTFFGFYRREFIEFGKWVFDIVFFFVAKNLKIVVYWQKAMRLRWRAHTISTPCCSCSSVCCRLCLQARAGMEGISPLRLLPRLWFQESPVPCMGFCSCRVRSIGLSR